MCLRLFVLLALSFVLVLPARAEPTAGEPALWMVGGRESGVVIVGVPGALPKSLQWKTSGLEARLKGAQTLLLPPQAKGGPLAAIKFLLKTRVAFQSPGPLEESLTPTLRARFVAARQTLGKSADRYAKWKPGVAGMLLVGDFRSGEHIAFGQPERAIRGLARSAHVREARVAFYDLGALLNGLTNLSEEVHRTCLADSLTQIEAGRARLQAAAQGWARGDLRAAMAAEGDYERCLSMIPALNDFNERSMADTTAAIGAAMTRPGRTVAVVDLRQLMIKGGVLDRLRARGLKVERAAD
ncbi:MAG TPA: TraB/GumN family protein [Caulobacteraceae bacterium]|nr:TraB/GumN family protein [Caulobacteraceae bacterium]